MKRWLCLALAGSATLAAAQQKGDWEIRQDERDWKELELRLPPLPKGEGLIEFPVSAAASFRFFIDPASLSVGSDGVVRYTLVARSPTGAENASYEGIRCVSGSYKVYAYAQSGSWSAARSDWKPIEPKSVQRWHQALRREYFCPFHVPISSVAEGLDALRQGGHPDYKQKY